MIPVKLSQPDLQKAREVKRKVHQTISFEMQGCERRPLHKDLRNGLKSVTLKEKFTQTSHFVESKKNQEINEEDKKKNNGGCN